MEIELSVEKSEEQATIIKQIKISILFLDVPYLKVWVKELRSNAHRYDSMAALNRAYDPNRSEILDMEAAAVEKLCEFVECLKKCDEIKLKIKQSEAVQDQIQAMFH